jgi:hypothetical protein
MKMSQIEFICDGEFAKLKDVKKGDYIKLTPESKKVYVKGDYDRASKQYGIWEAEDISAERFISGNRTVVVGFTY